MSEEFWSQMAATATGGMIAAIAGIVAIRYGKRLDRRDQRASLLVDAYADWARRLEETLSHHENFFKIAAQRSGATTDPDTKTRWNDEIIRVSTQAGDAGRRLDAAHYRILLLEQRRPFRDKVSGITAKSLMHGHETAEFQADPSSYAAQAKSLREELTALLKKLADAQDAGFRY